MYLHTLNSELFQHMFIDHICCDSLRLGLLTPDHHITVVLSVNQYLKQMKAKLHQQMQTEFHEIGIATKRSKTKNKVGLKQNRSTDKPQNLKIHDLI